MTTFFPSPKLITAETFASLPAELLSSKTTDWLPATVFLEGITTDTQGSIYVVDVPYGRILRLDIKTRQFSVIVDYDGEPNGLALTDEGMLVVADYKQGLVSELRYEPMLMVQLQCDPSTGKVSPLLTRRNMERFKGPNDLVVATNGDIYFTDQGQTGMSDPTGSVYRLSPSGKLDCLLSNGVSPNGLVLTPDEKVSRCQVAWADPDRSSTSP
ncbi:hypothetical protein IAU60_006414 [Kwoniella sp. DSM 27419]